MWPGWSIAAASPTARVVVLTALAADRTLAECLRAGVLEYARIQNGVYHGGRTMAIDGLVMPVAGVPEPSLASGMPAFIHAELALFTPNLSADPGLGVLQVFTSMFVHADFMHLLFNMVTLFFSTRRGGRSSGTAKP